MNKAKILSAAIAAAMLSSVACVTAFADPTVFSNPADIKDHSVALIGSFNGWEADEPMTDEDGDGVYEGTIKIDSVTADMVKDEWKKEEEPTGKFGIQFKVRLDGSWDDSWGEYEEGYVRTNNSQTNCFVEAKEGDSLTINVKFDTTKPCDEAVAAGECSTDEADKADWYLFFPVTYEVAAAEAEDGAADGQNAGTEDTGADTGAEDTGAEDTGAEDTGADTADEPTTTPADETSDAAEETPATGDATSAAALVGVVLASLGVAAVMAKKSRD